MTSDDGRAMADELSDFIPVAGVGIVGEDELGAFESGEVPRFRCGQRSDGVRRGGPGYRGVGEVFDPGRSAEHESRRRTPATILRHDFADSH